MDALRRWVSLNDHSKVLKVSAVSIWLAWMVNKRQISFDFYSYQLRLICLMCLQLACRRVRAENNWSASQNSPAAGDNQEQADRETEARGGGQETQVFYSPLSLLNMLCVAKMFYIRSEADSAAMRGQSGMQLGLGNNSRQLLVEGESGKYVDFCSLITFIQRRERWGRPWRKTGRLRILRDWPWMEKGTLIIMKIIIIISLLSQQ